MKSLKYLAIAGDALFILWVVYNGIDDGGQAIGTVQAVALIGLVFLLALNIVLLWKSQSHD